MFASIIAEPSDEEFPGDVADIESGAPPTDIGVNDDIRISSTAPEIVISEESDDQRQHVLHRVPPHVRRKNKQLYEPLVVSLGPYHHRQSHLCQYEDFKDKVLNIILNSDGGGAKDKDSIFRSEVLKRVDEIRSFYGGLSTAEYDDEAGGIGYNDAS